MVLSPGGASVQATPFISVFFVHHVDICIECVCILSLHGSADTARAMSGSMT